MANDAEKKNIARLDFKIDDAISSLTEIDKKLEKIAKSSEAYAKKIGDNLGNAVNSGNLVNTTSVGKDLDKVTNLSKNKADQLSVQLQKIEAKKQAQMTLQAQKGEQDRQTAAYKSALKQEENNQRVLDSTKTLYDKISEYAKTYIIYQGFNELRQGVKETIDEMVEMEYQMVQIDRVLNDSSLNIDIYRDKLIQMAYDYANSFENVADITLRLAQAGYDAEESLALTEKTLLALNTAELDATQATDDMVAVMAQWGLMTGTASEQAETYGNIIDKINKVADNFPTTSADILDALKKTSSAFNIAGASIDETIATIVAAEKASQRGGKTIGTALSNIVQQLKAEKKLDLAEELGLNFFTDAKKTEFRPIMEIFAEMSERMERLKKEGKESSTEMQGLLEMFTVFRRNIGASLLGEMAGEDSTYAQVLETSLNSVGYSLQENSKHLATAKAAQAQFNAELLKLKTQIWEGGLEEVFRDLLNLGKDVAGGIGDLIDKFGLLPVTVAAVTLAFTLLNKNTQASNWVGLKAKIQEVNAELNKTTVSAKGLNTALKGTNAGFQNYVKSIDKGKASIMGYLGYQVKATAQTILLTAKTILLQAAISGGITLAISFLVGAIDNWINAEEKAIEKHTELMQKSKENANTINNEITSIQELREEYEQLAKKDNRTTEENQKIYELQEKINELIKDTGTQVELVTTKINEQGQQVQVINDKYDEQLAKIKAIEYEKKRQEAEELRKTAENAVALMTGIGEQGAFFDFWGTISKQIKDTGVDFTEFAEDVKEKFYGMEISNETIRDRGQIFTNFVDKLEFQEQIKYLTEWHYALKKAESEGKNVGEALEWVEENLETLKSQQKQATDAVNEYNDVLSQLYAMLGFADTLSSSLQAIADTYDIEGPKKLIEEIQAINTEFSNGTLNIEQYFNKIEEKIGQINLQVEGEELEAYQAIFAETTKSLAEGLEGLISGLESGSINFADYSQGVKEAADNMLALRIEQNDLELVDGVWQDAAGNVDEYANSLQNAIGELEGMGDLLTVIGDNYDYIAEHANEAGEAIFNQSQVGTEAYTNLANGVAASLNKMKTDNKIAYEAITNDIFAAMGASANEVANADAYITEALNGNAQALNAALNASAAQVATSTQKVTTSMGKVLSELGKAISGFTYNIQAQPYIEGLFNLEKDENGLPKRLNLPKFGYDITGSGGDSVKNLGAALETFGTDLTEYGSNQFTYTQLKSKQKPYKPTTGGGGSSGGSGSSGSKGGSGGGSSSTDKSDYYAQREAEEAERARQKAYKESVDAFEDSIEEREKLEERWVKRQEQLGQLSNEDYLYIIQQRIERYKKYLKEVENATWLSEEDKLRLMTEYSEKIQDLEVDYLGYLEDQLNDEIEAIEEANKEKIKLIEEEADAKIAALKKVEDERDRERETEDYQKERQSILDEISYWEQRTGREAQENLARARKDLEELDAEWEDTQEDWATEDQIAEIEARRDAEIAAIEEAEKKEIEALKAIYDAKVKMYVETGDLIYEESVIQSESLYNAYKKNFIDPVSQELENLSKKAASNITSAGTTTTTSSPTTEQQFETYTIKAGDTLSKIAKKYGTTVEKLMAANPYITNKNKIYAGKTLQIPKFHEGGIVGGTQEAFALLKPHEVILKPEWADGINRLAKMAKAGDVSLGGNNTVVEVKGDLVRIDAKINDKTDAEYLTRRIEKMLKDKFNIKK